MGSSMGHACHGICGGQSAAPPGRTPPAAPPPSSPAPSSTTASSRAGQESCRAVAAAGKSAEADGIWLFCILLLAVVALKVPALADATGLDLQLAQPLMLLVVVVFICVHRSRTSRSSTKEPEPSVKSSSDGVAEAETPLDQLKRLLAEADVQFGGGEDGGHPTTEQEYRAQGWTCDRTSVSQVYMKFPKDPPPPRVLGDIRLNTIDQVPHFPLAIVNDQGELRGGAGPVYLSVGTWPSWFPFMHKCTKLGTLTDTEEIWHVEAKVLIFKADAVVMGSYQDRLDDLGQLRVIFIAPPAGSEGKQWLGITVPEKVGPLRVPINKMRLTLKPVTEGSSVVHFQVDHVDILGIDKVVTMVFSVLSKMVVPQLRKQIEAFEGSALQAFIRAPENSSRRDLYIEMHRRVREFLARRNAAGVGNIPP